MRILLKARSDNEFFEGDAPVMAMIDLDPELLKRRAALARQLKAEDASFYSLEFWSGDATFLLYRDELEEQPWWGALENECAVVSEDFEPLDEDQIARDEVQTLLVTCSGDEVEFRWEAYLKHTSVKISTHQLKLADIS